MAATDPTDPASSFGQPAPPAPGTPNVKLAIINQALINSANNTVTTPDDGSDEWRVASSGFDQWLGDIAYDRNWSFLTKISPPLQRVGDSAFPGYGDVYAKPSDCAFLVAVWRADLAAFIQPAIVGAPSDQYNTDPPPLDYAIIGDQIHTTAANPLTDAYQTAGLPGDFTPQSPSDENQFVSPTTADPNEFNTGQNTTIDGTLAGIICKYVTTPSAGQPWSTGFVAALRCFVQATCLRGLNEDYAAADACEKKAKEILDRAASRDTQQEPRRVAFRSRLNERRRFGRYGTGFYS